MQIKVRMRCRNPVCRMYTTCPGCGGVGWGEEEWESADVIFSGLNERIDQLAERIERLETSFRNVAIDVNNRIECLEAAWAAEHATYCQRCGEEYTPILHHDQGLCEECVSELTEEQTTMLLPHPDEEPF